MRLLRVRATPPHALCLASYSRSTVNRVTVRKRLQHRRSLHTTCCCCSQVKFAQQNWHDKLSVILEEFPKVRWSVKWYVSKPWT